MVRCFCKSSRQGVSPTDFLEMKHFVRALCCCHSVTYCFRFCMKASAGVFCVLYQHRSDDLCTLSVLRKNANNNKGLSLQVGPRLLLLILKCVYRHKGIFVAPFFSLHEPHHSERKCGPSCHCRRISASKRRKRLHDAEC